MYDNKQHTHDWEAIPNWWGRYRCRECKAIGYRATWNMRKVVPYKCRCGRLAQVRRKTDEFGLCFTCSKRRRNKGK